MKYQGRLVLLFMSLLTSFIFGVLSDGLTPLFFMFAIVHAIVSWLFGSWYDKSSYFSYHDPLTGVYNRRYAYAVLEKKFRRAEKRKQPVGIITFDIDEFKAINDSYGHDYGDYVLKEITRIVKRITRKEDILIRWGGDEFLLLLVNRDKAATEKFINDLNDTIKTICSRRYVKEENIYITLSVGYSLFPEDTKNLYQLITIADERMYEVKRGKKSS